ncbi:MAG TPA: hypothetical protein VFL87_06060 [Thermoleophilaceae bacterium]|nr:hypothetical protein [Thermoleophilaceae bacterium]
MHPKFEVHKVTVAPREPDRSNELSLRRVGAQLRGRAEVKTIEAGLEVTIRGNPSLGYAHVRAALSCAVGVDWADHFEITPSSGPGRV